MRAFFLIASSSFFSRLISESGSSIVIQSGVMRGGPAKRCELGSADRSNWMASRAVHIKPDVKIKRIDFHKTLSFFFHVFGVRKRER
jgi:hypothetical protein